MKGATLKSKAFFLRAQTTKVFGRFGTNVSPKNYDDPSNHGLADLNVKVDLRILSRFLFWRGVLLSTEGE